MDGSRASDGVGPGDEVAVHLTGRLVDGEDAGEVFETTDVDVALSEGLYHDHRDFVPLEFTVGSGEVLPGLDAAVRGMHAGETRTVTLPPEDAFGRRDPTAEITVSRADLEARSDANAEPDDLVQSEAGDVGWIVDVAAETVTVDFNHELAGERVEFDVRVLQVLDGGKANDDSTAAADEP